MPRSRTSPRWRTRIWSASRTVERRCATTSVVRPRRSVRERLLDALLGLGVDRGGGLVEHEDRRVVHERAREGDELALAEREVLPALADLLVEALGRGARGARRRARRAARASTGSREIVGSTEPHVLEQRAREEEDVLQHDRDAARGAIAASQSRTSRPSTRTRPPVDVVEARDERDDARLPGARRPHDRRRRPGRHVEGDAAEHGLARDVGEAHVLERDAARAARSARTASGRSGPARGVSITRKTRSLETMAWRSPLKFWERSRSGSKKRFASRIICASEPYEMRAVEDPGRADGEDQPDARRPAARRRRGRRTRS